MDWPCGRERNFKMIILDTLELNSCSRRPVWIMRQAGRYLKTYRSLRERYSFNDFAYNTELATQVTLLPFKQYELDAAVVFSDILLPLKAFGLEVDFTEKGPQISAPQDAAALSSLPKSFSPEEHTPTILETIKSVRSELSKEIAVMGFSGAPFTMLAYMLEGRLSKDLGVLKSWMAKEPELVHEWLGILGKAMGEYLDAQAVAGANCVQLFDTWASFLSPADYEEFALPYAREAISQVTVPCVYYVNGVSGIVDEVASVGAQALSVDWRTELGELRKRLSHVTALQGNLDPYVLLRSRSEIREAVFKMCSSYGTGPGHIVNLGHGIVPSIPEDSVKFFVEAVREWSEASL